MKKAEQELVVLQLNGTANMLLGMGLDLQTIKKNMEAMIKDFETKADAVLMLVKAPDGASVEFQVSKASANFVRSRSTNGEPPIRTLRAQFFGVNIAVQVLTKGVSVNNEKMVLALEHFCDYVKHMPKEASEYATADWPMALGSEPILGKSSGENPGEDANKNIGGDTNSEGAGSLDVSVNSSAAPQHQAGEQHPVDTSDDFDIADDTTSPSSQAYGHAGSETGQTFSLTD